MNPPREDGRRFGPRDAAERDATTVEIVFAIVSAAALGGLVLLLLASPWLWWEASRTWLTVGAFAGSAVGVVRLLWVLLRGRRSRT